MKSLSVAEPVGAPFPYFGGKSTVCALVWQELGDPPNYVEPFAGSAAMLLGRPTVGRTETINDADGFVANFWRAVSQDPAAVAHHADWPVNEADLFARHSWLVRHAAALLERLHADPGYYDAKIAGWWCWGSCCWIGSGWCSGDGPWVHDGERAIDSRQLPHLGDAGIGVNRQLPHLGDAGKGRSEFIASWMDALMRRTRDVRVTVGDWTRVLSESVTVRHGTTGVFLDPPYTRGSMDYAAGGVGGTIAADVREWCQEAGDHPLLRIVLCGHEGEHDLLLDQGWTQRRWKGRGGYASTDAAMTNRESETLWCSPNCLGANEQLTLLRAPE
ncbi:MAG: DNA adenine methylase [Acidimicrobiales bacterium]